MGTIVGFLLGAVCGFVGGFLVFRKHQKKINDAEGTVKPAVDNIKNG